MYRTKALPIALAALVWLLGCTDPPNETEPPAAVATEPTPPDSGPPSTTAGVPQAAPFAPTHAVKHARVAWVLPHITTTTTTTPPPPEPEAVDPPEQAAAAPASGPSSGPGTVNGYPCGGDLPPCYVLARESGGDPMAENPTSTASGLWQFLDGTWGGYAGYAHASHAPWQVQNERARQLWAGGAGCSHWSAC